MPPARFDRYPLGAQVRFETLQTDPYPTLARLRAEEPVSWIAELKAWYVTGYEDAREILLNEAQFTSESAQSPIVRSLGVQMLNIDGAEHARLRAI